MDGKGQSLFQQWLKIILNLVSVILIK